MSNLETEQEFDEWNPGLTSDIPSELMPQVTLYAPENSTVDYAEAQNASEFCGLKPHELTAFTVSRLIVHETLVRVSSDLFVPDGPNYEDLGISMRGMTRKIIEGYINPNLENLELAFNNIRQDITSCVIEILDRDLSLSPRRISQEPQNFLAKLFGTKKKLKISPTPSEYDVLASWQKRLSDELQPMEKSCLEGLCKIVGGILGLRGRLSGDREKIVELATNWICNSYGSAKIGEMIEPMVQQAVENEGYKVLPFQEKPVILNVKGASAAGKSSLRPYQKELSVRLGFNWEEFALLSTDYWRKYLLEYESMGKHYKYAAMLTGRELEVIDKKLDRHIGSKAQRKMLPHMLIDRFRFDSFSTDLERYSGSGLLSRFGNTVYLFFVITPPTETVVRAWYRGQTTGRYKAVDDLLFHNVEAYTGIPNMYIHWAKRKGQNIHFEFLDNSVKQGERPRTVAFGWNERLIILDSAILKLFHKFSSINLKAKCPEEVYMERNGDENNFLYECIEKLKEVTFVDNVTLDVMGQTQQGSCNYESDGFFSSIGLAGVGTEANNSPISREPNSNEAPLIDFEKERQHTVGSWG